MKRLIALLLLALLAAGAAEAKISVGCPVRVDEPVDGDVIAAGCDVKVASRVEGNVRLAGGSLDIGPDATVTGDASLAGGEMTIKGTVNGNVHAAGGRVFIDGTVDGNAYVAAGTVELGPNAKIAGKLRYRADSFERDPDAQVAKGIERTSRHAHRHVHAIHTHDDWDGFPHSTVRWVWTAGLMLLAGMVAALLPGFSGRMVAEMRERPGMAIVAGFIAFVCIPFAAVLLMVTIIGIPIGILALMGYAALLLVGYVVTSVAMAGILLDHIKAEAAQSAAWRAGAAVAAMLVIALIGRIPILGHFVAFAALIVGVGLIVATLVHRYRKAPTPAAA